jgi:hypothetical protein
MRSMAVSPRRVLSFQDREERYAGGKRSCRFVFVSHTHKADFLDFSFLRNLQRQYFDSADWQLNKAKGPGAPKPGAKPDAPAPEK